MSPSGSQNAQVAKQVVDKGGAKIEEVTARD